MTDFSRPHIPLTKGALVQIFEGVVGIALPNIVLFQYNPTKISHTITPWNPQEVDQTQRGAQAPMVQPFDPKESFSLSLELDATDDIEERDPIAIKFGVADRLAALKKLTYPSEGLFGDLIRNASALSGGPMCAVARPSVPVVLFVWGPGRIVPVRVTSFSVEETLYTPMLHPLHATVSLGLEVLTPDVFKCRMSLSQKIAASAYTYTRIVDDVLAIANFAQSIKRASGLPPFM
ncbi:hypothetical protein [Enhygromyxa salina]|uniref:Uncharacterized protein n=1 Tax=Enhygromyxa salina TaxID=215803 RepID=A0A2S9XJ14_9BACT|nr:hypothetical protein [Enhygromyxa salina]PRP92671.1 hypothetical protein ENSA7_81600 [Enhygromyxa salina]